MKSVPIGLFLVFVIIIARIRFCLANFTTKYYSALDMRQMCTFDWECIDSCSCDVVEVGDPKRCLCDNSKHYFNGNHYTKYNNSDGYNYNGYNYNGYNYNGYNDNTYNGYNDPTYYGHNDHTYNGYHGKYYNGHNGNNYNSDGYNDNYHSNGYNLIAICRRAEYLR